MLEAFCVSRSDMFLAKCGVAARLRRLLILVFGPGLAKKNEAVSAEHAALRPENDPHAYNMELLGRQEGTRFVPIESQGSKTTPNGLK